MAERGTRVAGSGGGGPEGLERSDGIARPRRVVALRPTSGPGVAIASDGPVAPDWAAASPAWPGHGGVDDGDGWGPARRSPSASALAESVFPFGSELPFEPDAEAAAFLNAPRRPLAFHVAPFGTPPFGTPPSGPRSVFGGPLDGGRGAGEHFTWGPAYPAGA